MTARVSAARLGRAGETLARALAWWGSALEASLPAWLVGLFAGDRACVRITAGEDGVLPARLHASPDEPAASATARLDAQGLDGGRDAAKLLAAARSRPVILAAPTAKILVQTVRTPAAALESLDEAVRFGLSTWTPFEPGEVVFHADAIDRTDDHARIRIRMIPRATLAPAIDMAARAGLNVSAVAFGSDLVRFGEAGEAVERKRRRSARIDLGLAASAVVLAAGLLIALHLGWSNERDDIQAAIRTEATRRSAQTKLETELAQLETRERVALTKRAADPRISAVMAELAGLLPETTEVIELEWSGRTGRLRLAAPPEVDVSAAIASSALVTARRERDGRGGAQTIELTAKAAR
ncbi:hypothetical protein [Methylopila sp. M107]|uniref:hypothetical protein n=1 Tax=Methylopila sp. M107 TaxID=1101190 RepID=UPI000379F733|nr:hypothetical protein [Methylopila sp. M107]